MTKAMRIALRTTAVTLILTGIIYPLLLNLALDWQFGRPALVQARDGKNTSKESSTIVQPE